MGEHDDQLEDLEPEVQDVDVERDPLELPTPTELNERQWDEAFDHTDSQALVPFGLTARQWKFVCEYLRDFNGAGAAKRAGYSTKSASAPTKLMRHPAVRDAIRWMLDVRAKLYSATHDRILQELCAIAFSDPHDYAQWRGNQVRWRDSRTIPTFKRRVVRAIKHTEQVGRYGTTQSTEIKFEPKIKALELLMKATGMLRELESSDNKGAFKKWADAYLSGELKPVTRALPDPPSEDADDDC